MASNKRLNAVISIGGAVTSSLKSALGDTKSRLMQIGGAVRQLDREQRNLSNAIGTFGRMGKNVDTLRARYAAVTTELEKQRRELQRVTSLESARQANLAKRGELRGKIGDAAVATGAVLLPALSSFKKSSEFNYQLQLIANTADLTKRETIALGEAVLDASRKTGQAAPDMLQAIGFLVAAGMEVKTAQASVLTIGRTATASGAEIEDLAKAAYVLQDALKIDPGQLQGALDILAQAGKEGNVELKDMAKQLPVLGAGFVSLKMEGREAAATMGAALEIARKGAGDADEAANNMKNYIAKIMSPETLKKAKKEFNLDLYQVIQDAQKTGGNPFEASMKAIMEATKGDQKAIGELFGDMQVQNFVRPMIQNWGKYEEIKRKALGASGVTDRDYSKVMATAKMQTAEVTKEAGRLGIALGNSLEPAFGKVASTLTPLIGSVTSFIDENRALVGNSVLVVGALTAIRVGALVAGYGFTFLKGAALASVAPLRLVGTTLAWLGRALLLNPLGLAVTAIAGGAYLIYKNWEPIMAWAERRLASIGAAWQKFKSFTGLGGAAVPAAAGAGAGGPALPALPGARGGAVVDQSTQNFNIYQQPGESQQTLAERIAKAQRQRAGSNNSMMDGGVKQ